MEAVLKALAPDTPTDTPSLCLRCDGTGWEPVDDDDRRSVRRCRDASHLLALLDKSQVPRTYDGFSLETFFASDAAARRGLARAGHFVDRFPSAEGLWISGPEASGKTHLAVGIVRALLALGHRGLRFYHAPELLRALDPRAAAVVRAQRSILRAEVASAKLLVLDDLGRAPLSRSESDLLNVIIDTRERASLPMLVTTPCRKSELSRFLGEWAAFAVTALCAKLSLWREGGQPPARPVPAGLSKLWDEDDT